MDFQLSYLEKERTYSSDSGTIYIDLPSNEQIAMIMVDFRVNNTSPTSRDYSRTILDVLKNVTVLLEGSKTAFSAAPEVGGFMAFTQQGFVPNYDVRERGATVIRMPIIFGRKLYDPEFMLDTGPYSSAQLQLEYELNTTYETTGTTQVTAYILRPTQRANLRGFIRSRVINQYTSSGSAEVKEVDLPTGLPWHMVGLRVFDIDQFIANNLTDLDLHLDEERMHIFDGRIEDLKELNNLWFGSEVPGPRVWLLESSDQYVQHIMADPVQLLWSWYAAGHGMLSSSEIWSHRHTLHMVDDTGAVISADRDVAIKAIGGHPFGGFALGMFHDQPFPAPQHSDAVLELTIGAYTCLFETFLQEVVEGTL